MSAFSLALAAISLTACGKSANGGAYLAKVEACSNISNDQRGSFLPPAQAFPIEVDADPGFTSDQVNEIKQAISTWNVQGQKLIGQDFFKLVVATVPSDFSSVTAFSCDVDLGTSQKFFIYRETSTDRWAALGFQANVPAATLRCYQNDFLTKQVIVTDPDLADPTQFSTVVLHELGHSLGLEHSCANGSGTNDWRACNGLSATDPYRVATMFPTISSQVSSSDAPSLHDNDLARASCLYGK